MEEPPPPPRWCKKCKAVFIGTTCPETHAIFMYTKRIPAEALPAAAPAAAAAPAPDVALKEEFEAEHRLRLSFQEEAAESTRAADADEAELRTTQEELASLRASLHQGTAAAAAPTAAAPTAPSPGGTSTVSMSPLEARLAALMASSGASAPEPPTVSTPAPVEPKPPAPNNILSALAASERRLSDARTSAVTSTAARSASSVTRTDSADLEARLAALLVASAPAPTARAPTVPLDPAAAAAAAADFEPEGMSDQELFGSGELSVDVAPAAAAAAASAAPPSPATVARVAEAYDWLSARGMSDRDIRAIEAHFQDQDFGFDVKALRGVGIEELRACLRSSAFRRKSPDASTSPSASASTGASASTSAPSAVSMEGWLYKAGGWNTAWKRRWFAMDGEAMTLSYYAKQQPPGVSPDKTLAGSNAKVRKTASFFECFPHICPDPVLAK
jgi:hypothetical protein